MSKQMESNFKRKKKCKKLLCSPTWKRKGKQKNVESYYVAQPAKKKKKETGYSHGLPSFYCSQKKKKNVSPTNRCVWNWKHFDHEQRCLCEIASKSSSSSYLLIGINYFEIFCFWIYGPELFRQSFDLFFTLKDKYNTPL